ncbi:MAG: phosphate acyltransferase [Planctomycetota bacterium]|nr:phosphate acyltransferase [Planctomycetota bacterium]
MPPLTALRDIPERLRIGGKTPVAVAVVGAEKEILDALSMATAEGLLRPVMAESRGRCEEIAGKPLHGFSFLGVDGDDAAGLRACMEMAARGEAAAVASGRITPLLIPQAMRGDHRLMDNDATLSHLAFFEVRKIGRVLAITDAAVNIRPDLDTKVAIVRNAIGAARRLGWKCPKVAMLSASETINYEHMPSSSDAAIIAKMGERGQIPGAILDGPLALDNAVSAEAARTKGIVSPVAGCADILVVADVESGNLVYKVLAHFAHLPPASVLVGGKVPVAMTGRADTAESKYFSTCLAALLGTLPESGD